MTFFIGIILFMVVFSAKPTQLGKTSVENLVPTESSQCFFYDENNNCVALVESSVIDINNVVESDQSIVEQFLDSASLLESKFGIETVVLLIDPFGNTEKSSNILNVPFYAVTDQQNRVLDLSDLKASFYFVGKEKSTSVTMQGDVEFYLDDVKIASKKIFVSGNTLTNQTLQMAVADSAFPSFSERKDGFGFTFIDEIPKWNDNTDHSFRIVIKKIDGQVLNDGQEPKTLAWTGEHVAYELKLFYDDTKLAVVSDNQVKLDVKSDSTISTCAMGGQATYGRFMQGGVASNQLLLTYVSENAKSPQIIIKENGIVLSTLSGSSGGMLGRVIIAPNQISSSIPSMQIIPPTNKCEKFESLKRDTEYIFVVEDKEFPVLTPKTQQNYFIQCDHTDIVIGDANPLAHSYYFKGYKYMKCSSNFGYEKTVTLIN